MTVGKIQVNGSDAGSLYSFTIGGDDASLLEVSSLGYLKLKANSKLDYETDQKLNFTLTAKNELNESKTTSFSLDVNDTSELVSSSISLGLNAAAFLDISSFNGSDLKISVGSEEVVGGGKMDQYDLMNLGIEIEDRNDKDISGVEINTNPDTPTHSFIENNDDGLPEFLEHVNQGSSGTQLDDLEDFLIINDVI